MKKHTHFLGIAIIFLITLFLIIACASQSQTTDKSQVENKTNKEIVEYPAAFALQQQFINKVNNLRSEGRKCGDNYFPAAKPLAANDLLLQTAYLHSKDMSENQFLDHVSSNGDTLVERLEKADYPWRAIAENVAHNQRSIDEVLDDWLSSPGHCSNLMSDDYRYTGVAHVNWYWTQVYATQK